MTAPTTGTEPGGELQNLAIRYHWKLEELMDVQLLIEKEAVRLANLVIGEDDQTTDDPKHHNYWCNELRAEQRRRLTDITGGEQV